MAIGDLKAEEQVLDTLYQAREFIMHETYEGTQRQAVLDQIRESIKRVQEARGQ